MNLTETPTTLPQTPGCPQFTSAAVHAACRRVAPLWPLQNFVAVNPFMGITDRSFIDACDLIRRVAPGGMQMAGDYYRDKYESGGICDLDLAAALSEARTSLAAPWSDTLASCDIGTLRLALEQAPSPSEDEVLSVTDVLDRTRGTHWSSVITEAVGHFCAAYYDEGQSAWRQPWKTKPLFAAWRETASLDANPELVGLKGFRQWVAALPEETMAVIELALGKLQIASEDLEDFLHKQLMSVRGWAGYVQYKVREHGMHGYDNDSLIDLLAIRLAYEAALFEQYDSPAFREFWPAHSSRTGDSSAVLVKYLWQLADEHAWQRKLLRTLRDSALGRALPGTERAAVQAVFCIDVRSEVFRRAFEAESSNIETLGFAGFFGIPLEYIPLGQHKGASHCPVLLTPKIQIRETLRNQTPKQSEAAMHQLRLGKRLTYSWNSFKSSAISCFSFVETAGLAFGAKLFQDAFAPRKAQNPAKYLRKLHVAKDAISGDETGIDLPNRIQLAVGALRNMGLTKNFARLVLLCGHGSETVNNPYGSGLDCGACGGHAGDANARVGAAILNDPAVRSALQQQNIHIPDDTWFLAGLHNTTTDDITLFDLDEVPASHTAAVEELERWLISAGKQARRERAVSLGLHSGASAIDGRVRNRSRDWAQTRPEWGLAGNAAFIAAPRERTRAAHLGGRVFLHGYDHREDSDNSTLELIMTAPMVVANWINLQYYASTVNNAVFGSGNKVTHNVVGTLGVCQGNTGDLQTGLPLQSVHDGAKWMHEPLRLHILLEAPREKIESVLSKHENVRQLVDHGWLLLFAIENEGDAIYRYVSGARWKAVDVG